MPQAKKNNIWLITLLLILKGTGLFAQHELAQPIGPYSRFTSDDTHIFVSGQIALNAQQQLDTSSVEAECRLILNTIKYILHEAGTDWSEVLKTTIYTTHIEWFSQINSIYETYVSKPYPARETVGVCSLPKHARIEISVIAKKRH